MAQVEDKDCISSPERLDVLSVKSNKSEKASPSPPSPSWLVGDVVWSKIPGHPWWPSMVSYDPNLTIYYQRKGRATYYHVQFFGQVPVRGWASERSVIKFEGREVFEASIHSKNHRVAPTRLPLWEAAVKAGEKALPMNRKERQLCFTFKYYDKDKEKGKEETSRRVKRLNGMSINLKPTSPTLTKNNSISDKEDNVFQLPLDESGNEATQSKVKLPRKRKRKTSDKSACSPSSTVQSCGITSPQNEQPVKLGKRIRKPKTKDLDVLDLKPQSLPLQNGETTEFPMNGGVSPTTALKLKIRKVKSPVDPSKPNNKRGRPPKETFIIVNDLEKPDKSVADSNIQLASEDSNSSKPEVSSTSAEVRPKRKKRRKLEDCFVTDDKDFKTTKPKEKQKPASKKKLSTTEQKTKVNEVTSSVDIVKKKKSKTKQEVPLAEASEVEAASTISSNDSEAGSCKGNHVTKKEREAVCVVCEQINDLIFCEGGCYNAFHPDCIGLSTVPKGKFICDECTSGIHSCFVCRQTGDVIQCSQPMCAKYYHMDCLKSFNCTKLDGERLFCPLHFCLTCHANKTPTVSRGRQIRCVRCPTSYHISGCLVAGCMPITSHLMVCAKHFMPNKNKAHHSHVNVNWCFVCSIGGTLICCESCPAAFHPECISYEGIPEGHFYCKDCIGDKALLYGDIVWVKLGMYRWWPAQICNPREVPTNIQSMRHQPGEFPVMFLGSHDYYWIHKGRVFSYQDGDKGTESNNNKYLEKVFKSALVEAKEKYAEWKKARESKAEQDLQKMSKKPAPFKHVKVNKCTTAIRSNFDPNEMPICECSANQNTCCGPDSNCLNRMLQFECMASKCPAMEKCQNQRFTKREYADLEPYRALNRGWGLKTKEEIKKGTFVIEYVGELIDEATCLERVKMGDDDTNYYMLTIDKDCIIDAGPMGNFSRFMNHSCNPNCETQKWTVSGEVRVGLFASRDIAAGEEITFDYRLDCRGNEKKKCHCGASNCSGFLGVKPKTQNAQLTEDKMKKAAKNKKKRQKKPVVKEIHEDDCFICGDGGQLIMCDKNGCAKCYHVSCLKLEKKPYGRWMCPWHFCDDCGKNATIKCVECPNSFCKVHAENQVTCIGNGKYLCEEHNPSDVVVKDEDKIPEAPQDFGQLCSLGFGDELVNGIPEIASLDLQNLPQNPQDLDHI